MAWSAPAEPGPEVTHVRDRMQVVWRRNGGLWWGDIGHTTTVGDESFGYEDHRTWAELLRRGPLEDVSREMA